MAAWEADYPDGITFFEPLLVSGAADGGSNYGDFEDPELDADGRPHQRDAARPGAAGRRGPSSRTSSPRDQAPWMTLFTQKTTNLTSPRFGGYYYDATKTMALGLAYLVE